MCSDEFPENMPAALTSAFQSVDEVVLKNAAKKVCRHLGKRESRRRRKKKERERKGGGEEGVRKRRRIGEVNRGRKGEKNREKSWKVKERRR